ncbi:MAG: rod shape-determining protein MreC [Candidatus Margulisiibacteriota bacterium]
MKKFFIILVVTITLAFGLSFIQNQWLSNSTFINTKSGIFSIISLPNKLISDLGKGISGSVASFFHLKEVERTNHELNLKLDALEVKLAQFRSLEQDNYQLRNELRYRTKALYNLKAIGAEVVARSMDTWFSSVVIDKGWKDGVDTDYAVVNSEGLVGRIIESGEHFSKVMLIQNQNSNVSAVLGRTQDKGIIQGRGNNTLMLKYIPNNSELAKGDLVYTSGMSIVFAKGILIGQVSNIVKKKYDYLQYVEVAPAVNFAKLDKVWVVAVADRSKIPEFKDEAKATENKALTSSANVIL